MNPTCFPIGRLSRFKECFVTKKALITGITGQDGSYLAELLLRKGYEVYGIVRRSSSFNRGRIDHLPLLDPSFRKRLHLLYGDLNDTSSLMQILAKVRPHEVYNLAAQSHVKVSFEIPESTAEVGALGALRILESLREICPDAKFYQASTSELFGIPLQVPQTEKTPMIPRSPYGAAKLYSFWMTNIYRQAYGLRVVNGILFNHESPRRGESFVTRKVSLGVAKIQAGHDYILGLGNLSAIRDWGYAPEYVYGMWLMLQKDFNEDFVLATGRGRTVREMVDLSFQIAGIDLVWEGEGESERAFVRKTNRLAVKVDPAYYRPLEVDHLLGDASKAREKLGWSAQVALEKLMEVMVRHDIQALQNRKDSFIDQPLWPEQAEVQ